MTRKGQDRLITAAIIFAGVIGPILIVFGIITEVMKFMALWKWLVQ